jgi:hydrogenase maturation factor
MKTGKLSNDLLSTMVLSQIDPIREDVLIRPAVGEDCTAVAFGDLACVMTTDPITGSSSHLGRLAVHICVNDIASSGAKPVGLMLTLLCPEGTAPETIQEILKEANQVASTIDVEILGGHTEITSAVNKIILSATAVGKIEKDKLIKTGGSNPGDYIYITKSAGLEGTAIIATDKRKDLLELLSNKELKQAEELIESISVLKEGLIGAEVGAAAMHDATEGGVLGAIYELCEAGGVGCMVQMEKFNILEITQKICDHFHLDPLKLISSGSMIIAISPEKAGLLESRLNEEGIEFSKVGKITEERDMKLYYGDASIEEVFELIEPPESDELYKVI